MSFAVTPKYAFIVPTFGRPDEVDEFLQSLTKQENRDFEVLIADGTPKESLEKVVRKYEGSFPLTFLYEEFLPVSAARNLGAQHAKAAYFIFLDSDCIIPPGYLDAVDAALQAEHWDCFGGPDAAHESFTPVQKAISYSMTSLFTTGGIRGNKNHVGKFHPRGFNMGISRTVFEAVGGYSTFRCGEDIELSIRIIKAGFKVGLIPEAYVFHKRRTDFLKFFKQVFRFGAARINIYMRHKEELKITHLFPFVFLVFLVLVIPFSFLVSWKLGILLLFLLGIYKTAIFLDASIKNKSLYIGLLSVRAAFTQLTGYGYGFARNAWEVFIKGNKNGMKL